MPESYSTSTIVLLIVSSMMAGAVNAVAGGGTLLTFPALTAVMSKVLANATSTVALMPGSMAGTWGYRKELREVGRWPLLLVIPSLVGGLIGAELVTRLPPSYFASMVPWLILLATLLFLLQPTMIRLSLRLRPAGPVDPHRRSWQGYAALATAQFFIAVYGGYFGAGIGILMLSALGLMGLGDIHQMNAVKAVLAACINCLAVFVFAFHQAVVWPAAIIMGVSAVIGGFLGAHFGRRLPKWAVRWFVIVIGFGLAAKYFYEQLQSNV